MAKRLLGMTEFTVNYEPGRVRARAEFIARPGFDFHFFTEQKWDELFPGKVILKCKHCGQWGVVKTPCVHCGAPINEQ